MGALDLASVRAVALDTAPLIYYVEEHPKYLPLVEPLIEAIDEGKIAAYTSMITLISEGSRESRRIGILRFAQNDRSGRIGAFHTRS